MPKGSVTTSGDMQKVIWFITPTIVLIQLGSPFTCWLSQKGSSYWCQFISWEGTVEHASLLPPPTKPWKSGAFHSKRRFISDFLFCFCFYSAARKVTVKKPLSDVETFEKESVTFELELSHANVSGVWTRNGIRVKPSSTCRVSATGHSHSLTLLGLTLDDSGTVAFTGDTVRSSARLIVRGTRAVRDST